MPARLAGQPPDRYQVVGAHERGGVVDAYRGVRTSIGSEVAIRVLPVRFLQVSSCRQRCAQDVKTNAGRRHPHILLVRFIGEQGGLSHVILRLTHLPDTLVGRVCGAGRLSLGGVSLAWRRSNLPKPLPDKKGNDSPSTFTITPQTDAARPRCALAGRHPDSLDSSMHIAGITLAGARFNRSNAVSTLPGHSL